MRGYNLAIPGCFTSRATAGVALLGMPKSDDEYNVNWRKNISWSLRYGWLMLAWRGKLKGGLYTLVKRIILRRNWFDVSIKLWPYYDCSKLFLQKTLVNLRKKIEKSTLSFYTKNFLSTTITPHLTSNLAVCVFWVTFLNHWFFLDATRTTLIPGTVPTLNLPQKSIPSSRWVH